MKTILVLLVLTSCGSGYMPARYELPDGGVDGGCVFEGEDGAQWAESTVAWWPPPCVP